MTNLLIDEPPLQVLPSLAVAIGLNEALILQQVHYWIGTKKRAPDKNKETFRKGEWWVYNSVPEWNEQFPFWGDNTIRRALASLREQELLITEQLSSDPRDKTLWYRIDYPKLETLTAYHHKPKGSSKKKWADASTQNGQSTDPEGVDANNQGGQTQLPEMGTSLTETPPKTTQRIHQRAQEAASPRDSLSFQEGKEQEQPDGMSLERQARRDIRKRVGAHPPSRDVMEQMYQDRLAELKAEKGGGGSSGRRSTGLGSGCPRTPY